MSITNDKGELSLGGIMDVIRTAEDATSMSLFQYTKRSTINSRMFIEQSLANEEILSPLVMNIMNLYTGLILTAMDMNRHIQGSKKVRDAMSVVSTESLREAVTVADGMESFFKGVPNLVSTSDILYPGEKEGAGGPAQGTKLHDFPKEANIPSGRLIEVKFGLPDNKGSFAVNLFLQLLPRFIPAEVASQFVGLNFSPSIRQRWMQCSAGEISTISDFMLGQDMRKRRREALKNDKTGVLKEMVNRQQNSLADAWLKFAQITPEKQNIANTILIFDKSNFDKACSRHGLNFKKYSDRQRFFNKSFAMMLCTIDPMYNKIEMFYHGLDAVSNFTFDMMKKNAKSEATDLVSIMKMYAQGQSPKF